MFKSAQTKVLGVTSLLAVLAGATYYATKGEVHKSGKFLLFASIPLLINLYTVHCVIFGRCTLYSWLLTVVLTAYAAGIFFMYGKLLMKRREAAAVAAQKQKMEKSVEKAAEEMLGLSGIGGF
jgi:hypothetical protein